MELNTYVDKFDMSPEKLQKKMYSIWYYFRRSLLLVSQNVYCDCTIKLNSYNLSTQNDYFKTYI